MRLEGSSALVTGGAGFLGSHLIRSLIARGFDVHLLLRNQSDTQRIADLLSQVTVHRGDLRELASVSRIVADSRPDIIFHAAVHRSSSTAADREEALSVATQRTLNILETLRSLPATRLICFGSSTEYGVSSHSHREDEPLDPICFHGAVKASATLLTRMFARTHNLPVTILRPFLVYGPGESHARFIPALLQAIQNGREFALTPPGLRHDFVYIDDVIDACLRAAVISVPPGEVINIGSGTQWANEEVVALAERVTGRALRVRQGGHQPRPWDRASWVADVSKAKTLLGWTPAHTLEHGLREIWASMSQTLRIADAA